MYIIIEFNAEERDFGKELSQTGRLEGQVLARASLKGIIHPLITQSLI